MNKLQEACIISHEHWLKELEQTIATLDIDIPEIKIPEKTKGQIVSIKDAKSKSKKDRTVRSKVIKILIIAAIIASLLVSAVAFTPFREFVVEFFDDYNSFENNNAEVYFTKNIELSYIPQGFVLTNENTSKYTIANEYKKENMSFVITKNAADTYYRISNTYSEEIIFYKDNVKYTLLNLTDECTKIVWLTNEYSYILTGFNMSNEELIKIAKNIK